MSNLEKIQIELSNNRPVYLYDIFEDVVCKIVPEENKIVAFVKFKGKEEYSLDPKSNLVFKTELGGVFITKKEYEEF